MKTSLVLLLIATCGPQDPPDTADDRVRARPPAERLVALESGEDVTEEEMLADLERGKVIYVGEIHDDARDHAVQYRLLRSLYERHPSIGVGMEMFQFPFQSVLDDWTAGQLDETNLRRRSEWDQRWGFDYAFYRPILEWTRNRGVPLVALNARTEVTRTVASEGLEGLSEAQRAELPPLNLGVQEHRALVMEALGEHAHGAMTPRRSSATTPRRSSGTRRWPRRSPRASSARTRRAGSWSSPARCTSSGAMGSPPGRRSVARLPTGSC